MDNEIIAGFTVWLIKEVYNEYEMNAARNAQRIQIYFRKTYPVIFVFKDTGFIQFWVV